MDMSRRSVIAAGAALSLGAGSRAAAGPARHLARRFLAVAWIALWVSLSPMVNAGADTPVEIQLAPEKPTFEDAASLVRASKDIALVNVYSLQFRGRVLEYRAKVVETIKGTSHRTIVIRIAGDDTPVVADEKATFTNWDTRNEARRHDDIDFWLGAAGPVVPRFFSGFGKGTYLLFLDKPNHFYGAEPTTGPNDPWYLAVKAMAANPALKGRSFAPIEFLKMFGSVYLAECGQPRPHDHEPGKVWGEPYKSDVPWHATLHDAHPPDFIDPDFDQKFEPCAVRSGQSFYYLAAFVDAYTQFPIAILVENGIVRFDQRYGNIALTVSDVPLETVINELRTAGR